VDSFEVKLQDRFLQVGKLTLQFERFNVFLAKPF
jgi:hypothetical protein